MIIKIESISNPGISFTEDVNVKLISLYKFVEQNENREVTYADFQLELINNKIFTGSYIRSFIPFVRNFGIINDYNIVNYNNFFTKWGKVYIENLIDYYNVKTIQNEEILFYFKRNKSDLLCLFLDYLCSNKNKYYDRYLDILYFVKKYGKICKEEFYIYEYCKINKIDPDELIKQYRENPNIFEIKVTGRDNMEIGNNAFNYFIALLSEEQCNYVFKSTQSYYQINANRINLINSIVNQYIEYGG